MEPVDHPQIYLQRVWLTPKARPARNLRLYILLRAIFATVLPDPLLVLLGFGLQIYQRTFSLFLSLSYALTRLRVRSTQVEILVSSASCSPATRI